MPLFVLHMLGANSSEVAVSYCFEGARLQPRRRQWLGLGL
jgi:hypothetical protein